MGMISLDEFELQIIMDTNPEDIDSKEEREELIQKQKCARKLAPIISASNHHNLLGCWPKFKGEGWSLPPPPPPK